MVTHSQKFSPSLISNSRNLQLFATTRLVLPYYLATKSLPETRPQDVSTESRTDNTRRPGDHR
ncbi:MAG TPA: hypothetical protein VL096_19325 [Pirellulaceae bacterium]|nr:hypothetical protein [Pirellulaceae bacterium]